MRYEKICSIEGCGKKHFSRSWCQTHFARWKRHGFAHETMQERKAREKTRHTDNPHYHRDRIRRLKYGYWPGLYEQLMELQAGCCDICKVQFVTGKQNPKDPCADHTGPDHAPIPRGILCRICNVSLGNYEKHQKIYGVVIEVYDTYLANTPVDRLTKTCTTDNARQLSLSF